MSLINKILFLGIFFVADSIMLRATDFSGYVFDSRVLTTKYINLSDSLYSFFSWYAHRKIFLKTPADFGCDDKIKYSKRFAKRADEVRLCLIDASWYVRQCKRIQEALYTIVIVFRSNDLFLTFEANNALELLHYTALYYWLRLDQPSVCLPKAKIFPLLLNKRKEPLTPQEFEAFRLRPSGDKYFRPWDDVLLTYCATKKIDSGCCIS